MRILLVVQREDDAEDAAVWIAQAADEYTLDEHKGMPDFIRKALDADPANTRLLWLEVGNNAMNLPFREPIVPAAVVE